MRDNVPQSATKRARTLRRTLTPAERKLWHALRDRRIQQLKFRRQAPVGAYIADFLCLEHRLIVEADGSHTPTVSGTQRATLGLSLMATRSCDSGIARFCSSRK